MPQLLLLPDPKPLVDRLGADFFRQAPESPGVYLMRDAADVILYIGKAKNLRKRLASYRVANPDRLRRRQLRLLRAVARIELQECADETSALAREASLLRNVRPRFNRAGTWPGSPRFLGWRLTPAGLRLSVAEACHPNWVFHGPYGGAAFPVRAALLRLVWCAVHAEHGLTGLPQGWFSGHCTECAVIAQRKDDPACLEKAEARLRNLFKGEAESFITWVRDRTAAWEHPFEVTARDTDLETIQQFAAVHLADKGRGDMSA